MKTHMKCLLIGGPADGQWVHVETRFNALTGNYVPQESIMMLVPVEQKLTPCLGDCPVELEAVYVEYQAYPFQEGDTRSWVYTTGSGPIMQKLLDGYRKESK
jgi:hypothetical protein